MKKSKKIWQIIIGMVLIATLPMGVLSGCKGGSTAEEQYDEDTFLKNIRQSVVMITVSDMGGSGVMIDCDNEKLTIATVYHLLEGYEQGIVTFQNNKVGFADVTRVNASKDICLLEIKLADLSEEIRECICVAALPENEKELAQEGDSVFLIGSATGVAENVTKGTVAATDYYVPDFDMKMLYLYCDAFERMSGAGCFDDNGILQGLLAGGTESSEAVCIPIKDVIDMKEGFK